MENTSKKGSIFVVIVILIGLAVAYFGYQTYQNEVVNKNKSTTNNTEEKDNNNKEEEPQKLTSCFVGDKKPVINKNDYDEADYNSFIDFTESVDKNCSCLSKNLKVLNNPIDDETKKEVQDYTLKDRKFGKKDMTAFNEEFDPTIGYTKFVYNYTVCSARTDGDSCYVAAIGKVKDEWVEEIQHMNPTDWSLEQIYIEKQIDKFCK